LTTAEVASVEAASVGAVLDLVEEEQVAREKGAKAKEEAVKADQDSEEEATVAVVPDSVEVGKVAAGEVGADWDSVAEAKEVADSDWAAVGTAEAGSVAAVTVAEELERDTPFGMSTRLSKTRPGRQV